MAQTQEVTNRVFTLANCISFARLCLVPTFLYLFFHGHNGWATFTFALAACTDFVDGQVARRTNTVSRVGQLLDPAVDVALMISGVFALLMSGRLPIWIVLFILVRDGYLLGAGVYLLMRYKRRVPVILAGKAGTTLLYIGFGGLLLNAPLVPGLGICDISWLPGFNGDVVSWGIWFIYAGMILASIVTVIYIRRGLRMSAEVRAQWAMESQAANRIQPE